MIDTGNLVRYADSRLRQIASFCLDVIFPPVCAGCGQLGTTLCANCISRMERVPEAICYRCGRMADGLHGRDLCDICRDHPPLLAQMRAPLRYKEPTSQLIHRLKYEGFFALGEPLAQFLIDGWPLWADAPEIILPIPLHARRYRQRGYNQSELLARPLGRAFDISVSATALRRTRHTVPQVGLGPLEREANVKGAFLADGESVGGRHVLLIDDVLTTGATMTAAAEAVLAAGASAVSAYCLARVS